MPSSVPSSKRAAADARHRGEGREIGEFHGGVRFAFEMAAFNRNHFFEKANPAYSG
jgi:hypothetical protein